MRQACSKGCWKKPSQVTFQRKVIAKIQCMLGSGNTPAEIHLKNLHYSCFFAPDCKRFLHTGCQMIGQKNVCHCPWWAERPFVLSLADQCFRTHQRELCLNQHPSSLRTSGSSILAPAFSHAVFCICSYSGDLACPTTCSTPCLLRVHIKWMSNPISAMFKYQYFSQSPLMVIKDIVFNISWFSPPTDFFYNFPIPFHCELPQFLSQFVCLGHHVPWAWGCKLVMPQDFIFDNSLRNDLFLFSQCWCSKRLCYKSHYGIQFF